MKINFSIDVPVQDKNDNITRGDLESMTDDFVRLVQAWFVTYNNKTHVFGVPEVERTVTDVATPEQRELKLEFFED
jgi:hypothetical protein|tara:strand:- start:11758 stop:11985 length:228 start_codon:yes stop_codon:yes gene_type:complete